MALPVRLSSFDARLRACFAIVAVILQFVKLVDSAGVSAGLLTNRNADGHCHNAFTCNDGSCVDGARQCDWYYDCLDESDEHGDCQYTGFTCGDGTEMVSTDWVCDGSPDCRDKSDENHQNCAGLCPTMLCDGSKCLKAAEMCDGAEQCRDAQDEVIVNCIAINSCFQCGRLCINSDLKCDFRADCSDLSDESTEECGPVERRCWLDAFMCHHGLYCIPQSWRCDNESDCGDGSDETKCDVESTWDPVGWSEWSAWSNCSADCGIGKRFRHRTCDLATRTACTVGKEVASEACQVQECIPEKEIGCGTRGVAPSDRDHKRIVGGQEAGLSHWPWQAQLIYTFTDRRQAAICGGTLIRDNLVLTAAHCFVGRMNNRNRWAIHLGKHTLNLTLSQNEQSATVRRIIKHSRFKPKTMKNDLAILVLDRLLHVDGVAVNIACLDTKLNMAGKNHCFSTGWGLTEMGGHQSDTLQQARMPILNSAKCNAKSVYSGMIGKGMICAGHLVGGIDACQGDSGGPLTCEFTDGRWYLVGLTSWGHGCAIANKPGVFTQVAHYRNWIEKVIHAYSTL